jgi:gamma-glutamylcysteine synthetase
MRFSVQHQQQQNNNKNKTIIIESSSSNNNDIVTMIKNFRRFLNVVFFLLGDSPAYEFYVPNFWNILSVPSS